MSLMLSSCGGVVDLGQHAVCAVVIGLQAGLLGLPGRAELEQELLVRSACSAQTGRWQGWWVAWGQRAESHIPISGRSAAGVPASLR